MKSCGQQDVKSFPPPALPFEVVISVNWEDFLISSQGSIFMLVLLRKQIEAVISESGWEISPSALKVRQPQLRHCPGVRLLFGWNGPDNQSLGSLGA